MSEPVPVFEAKRWVEKTSAGGTRSQVFELRDSRYAIVKFPENPQGIRVLVNEFICCSLADMLELPVNRALLVSIDGRLLKDPQSRGECPPEFTGGIRCGLIRYPDAVHIAQDQLGANVENSDEIHALDVFDALVTRGDGRQLLAYPVQPHSNSKKNFAAIDYGYAFGGSPTWTPESFKGFPDPVLPMKNPLTGLDYTDGALLKPMIDKLRSLTQENLCAALTRIHPPRWEVSVDDLQALAEVLNQRRLSLISQFDTCHKKQMEVFNE